MTTGEEEDRAPLGAPADCTYSDPSTRSRKSLATGYIEGDYLLVSLRVASILVLVPLYHFLGIYNNYLTSGKMQLLLGRGIILLQIDVVKKMGNTLNVYSNALSLKRKPPF